MKNIFLIVAVFFKKIFKKIKTDITNYCLAADLQWRIWQDTIRIKAFVDNYYENFALLLQEAINRVSSPAGFVTVNNMGQITCSEKTLLDRDGFVYLQYRIALTDRKLFSEKRARNNLSIELNQIAADCGYEELGVGLLTHKEHDFAVILVCFLEDYRIHRQWLASRGIAAVAQRKQQP